jgi:hypothetical protein
VREIFHFFYRSVAAAAIADYCYCFEEVEKNNLRLSCENSSLLFNFARTFAMLINLSLIM